MCGSFEIEKKRDATPPKEWKEWITNRILVLILLTLFFFSFIRGIILKSTQSQIDIRIRMFRCELIEMNYTGRALCVRSLMNRNIFLFFFKRRPIISPIRSRKWQMAMAVIFLRLIIYCFFLWVSLSTALTPKMLFIECVACADFCTLLVLSFHESLKCHCENLP